MIYSPSRFVFVHLPRTGGFSIMQALASRIMELGDVTLVSSPIGNSRRGWWCHSRACELIDDIPHWQSLWRWAVIRNPWDMVASRWRWTQRHWTAMAGRPMPMSPGDALHWRELYAASRMTFAEWIPWAHANIATGGGFWRWYCCRPNGQDLGVDPVRYDELPRRWPQLMARLGLAETPLPRLNDAPLEHPAWTSESIDLVAELCRDDVERFRFEPPRRDSARSQSSSENSSVSCRV